ncbi:MAG: dynamin family protein [Chloroflexota bacterium]|nr:dynamin family protein [Chloroflexota bacterium]
MPEKILTEAEQRLLKEERQWLTNLQIALTRFDAAPEDRAALDRSVRQLDELFLLVVVGEFNSGKSAFINALLGQPLLEEGVTPTTTRVHLLKYGETFERIAVEAAVDVYAAPAPLLKEINIVDTPGTNAIHRQHEAITREFVPRSDMVLFITSVDRPFTESERVFLERIRDWGKKVVVLLNKTDILTSSEDLASIEQFITENARTLLGFTPQIFPISSRLALRARQEDDAALLAESGFALLEQYIVTTLDERERVHLKLSNPLGVGLHLVAKYLHVVDGRLALLQEDFDVMEDIERHLAIYRDDMGREFRFRLKDVENVLYEFESRGMVYFDEMVRLARIFDLIKKAQLEEQFERQVIAGVPQVIETRVNDIIDWLISSNLNQWQAVMEHVQSRRDKHADRIVGQVGGAFDYDRVRLIEAVSQAAQQAMTNYDHDTEAERVAESLQMAVAGTALVEVGALGLGAIVTAIATTAAADLTGILAAGAVAVLGLFVIPTKRRQVKRDFREKIISVREQLMHTLTTQFERELARSLNEIETAVSPYTRFIRAERQQLEDTRRESLEIKERLERLKAEIEE